MDNLINSLHQFNITKKVTACNFVSLDDLVDSFKCTTMEDAEAEWERLKENYSKLRYIKYLIELYEIHDSVEFVKIIDQFMEYIDKMTQYYLKEIDFEFDDPETIVVKNLLEESLNCPNSIKRLNIVLDGYDILIPIIEDYRNEKFKDLVDDQEFLKKFHHISKKRKQNF